jgi:hypothetical protein
LIFQSKPRNVGYICSWQQDEDAIANLKASGQRIQQASSQIIDWIEGSFAIGA